MDEEKINMALEIVNQRIAELMKEYAYSKNENTELKEKMKVLEEIKNVIYVGNVAFAEKVLEENKKGKI